MNKHQCILVAGLLVLLTGPAGAAVYKTVDEQGNVVYTDDPVGEPVDLPPLSTVPPPKNRPATAADDGGGAGSTDAGYRQVAITSPSADETVRDNPGNVLVKARVEPGLKAATGHRLQFFVDGEAYGEPVTEEQLLMPNMDRGTHTVSVAVVGPSGRILQRSDEVRFYLHRQSINFPTRQGN